jgi:hypothetical protein
MAVLEKVSAFSEEGTSSRSSVVPVDHDESIKPTRLSARMASTSLKYAKIFVQSLFTPPNMAIMLALVIGSIPVFKSLFVGPPSSRPLSERTMNAPIGFAYEVIDFLGNASIQLGILNIGAAFYRLVAGFLARLKATRLKTDDDNAKPTPFTKRMLTVSVLISALRLLLFPVIGILVWEFLLVRRLRWIDERDVMLRFILMFQSAVPTAQMTVVLTQALDPTGDGWHISSVTFLQYMMASFTVSGWLIAIFVLLYSPVS